MRPFWFGINVLSYMIHGACTTLEQMYGCYLYLNTGCARLRNVMIHFLHLWNVVFTYFSIIRSVCVWSRKTHFMLFCAVHAYFMLSPSVDREICVYISYFNWCWAIRRKCSQSINHQVNQLLTAHRGCWLNSDTCRIKYSAENIWWYNRLVKYYWWMSRGLHSSKGETFVYHIYLSICMAIIALKVSKWKEYIWIWIYSGCSLLCNTNMELLNYYYTIFHKWT